MEAVAIKKEYHVIMTDTGEWRHAPGSDFLFAFIKNSWDESTKSAVGKAFETALQMSSNIKEAVLNTSGEKVVNGLYTLDQAAMTKAMNSIKGMGMTSANQQHESGSGTTVSITKEFFTSVLAGLGGDVAPLMTYLTKEMGDLQAESRKSKESGDFGTVIGMIGVMPDLGIPVTTFRYAFSSQQTKEWFVKVPCGSVEHHSYDFGYTTVDYNYIDPGSAQAGQFGPLLANLVHSHQALCESHQEVLNLLTSAGIRPYSHSTPTTPKIESCISQGIRTEKLDQAEEVAVGLPWLTGTVTVKCLVGLGFAYMIASGIRLRITNRIRQDGRTIFDFSYDGRETRRAVTEAFEKGKHIVFSKD